MAKKREKSQGYVDHYHDERKRVEHRKRQRCMRNTSINRRSRINEEAEQRPIKETFSPREMAGRRPQTSEILTAFHSR